MGFYRGYVGSCGVDTFVFRFRCYAKDVLGSFCYYAAGGAVVFIFTEDGRVALEPFGGDGYLSYRLEGVYMFVSYSVCGALESYVVGI